MGREYSIAEARDNFTTVVREAEAETAITLTRHGRAVAVILSIDEYERLKGEKRGFWEAYQEFAANTDLPSLAIEEDVFPAPRDREAGRPVDL